MKKRDVLLKVWAGQVRDLAYDIEDCLDEFRVHLEQQSQLRQLKKLKHCHRIAIMIRDLKSRVEDVSNRSNHYKLIDRMPDINTDRMDYTEDIRNLSVNNVDEGALLGLDSPKADVLHLLDIHNNIGSAKVVSVVGMGGLGKTTLAMKVSESNDILRKFSRHAWITVSQSFDKKELLINMILKLMGHDSSDKYAKDLQRKQSSKEQVQMKRAELRSKQIEELISELTQELKEVRYFVVLDDLWKKDHWEWINHMAFPVNNNEGSRIIVTTRDVDLAKMCSSPQLVYQLGPLKDDDAKRLLLRKTNKTEADLEKDSKLNGNFNKILRKCGGLPLAIVTIGGVLATKHADEWKDFEIKKSRLVNRWIAEGFIVPTTGMAIEEILEVVNIKRSGLKIVKELGELTQLRKLGLVGVSKKQGKELSAALDKLPYLRSLRLDSGSFDPHWLGSIPTLPLHLQSLRLQGHLSPLPSWVAALTNLRKIYLSLTCLVQDDLRVLGTLPNLMHLQFDMKSYIGEKLLFYSGAFPILRTLQLYFPIQSATEVAFEKGASPKMERITIRNCDFTSGITGIRNLPNLQEISLKTDAKVAKLDSLEREMNAHPNHPVLTMWMSRSEHDLGDEEVFEAEEHSTRPPFHEVGQSSQSGAGDESMYNSTTKLKRSQSWRTWTAKTSYH
ncbi:hypothetical protein GUJ93_ZPchr0006g46466 [Zizania palustris]|uniref:Uncharacterized protein n=1 Tax=Zizania palustris TaxID=103762 RepID=A0A8J5VQ82_ZIZPA|nr:hypothetical protein GUJ93_ZPchr0006g46466 [Zizania palustris]